LLNTLFLYYIQTNFTNYHIIIIIIISIIIIVIINILK